jgi:outer membrane receptor for ferrienterochelin and colicin
LRVTTDTVSAELFGFFLHVDDKIEAIPTGETLPDGRMVVRSENVNEVDFAGIESGASWTPAADLEVYGSLNYTWGEEELDDGHTTPGDRVPPVNGQVELWWQPLSRIWLEPFLRLAGKQDRLSDRDKTDPRVNPQGTSSWLTVNTRVGVELNEYVQARLTLENIFDENYREHGSGIDAPGTDIVVALDARW